LRALAGCRPQRGGRQARSPRRGASRPGVLRVGIVACCTPIGRSNAASSRRPADVRRGQLLPELLGQVGLVAELLQQAELRLEPVEMLLLTREHVLEQVARGLVALL